MMSPRPGRLAAIELRRTPRPRVLLTAAKPDLLRLIAAWVCDGHMSPADLAYEGKPRPSGFRSTSPRAPNSPRTNRPFNAVHDALRCLGERANSLLKTTYKVLRRNR